jgi:hypothetical protein
MYKILVVLLALMQIAMTLQVDFTAHENGTVDLESLRIVDARESIVEDTADRPFHIEILDEQGGTLRTRTIGISFERMILIVSDLPSVPSEAFVTHRIAIEPSAHLLRIRSDSDAYTLSFEKATCELGICEGCEDYFGFECEHEGGTDQDIPTGETPADDTPRIALIIIVSLVIIGLFMFAAIRRSSR